MHNDGDGQTNLFGKKIIFDAYIFFLNYNTL